MYFQQQIIKTGILSDQVLSGTEGLLIRRMIEKRLGTLKPLPARPGKFPATAALNLPADLDVNYDPASLAEVAFSWGVPAWADHEHDRYSAIPTGIINIAETSDFSRLIVWCRENHFDLRSTSSGEFAPASTARQRLALEFGPDARRYAYDPIKNVIVAELGTTLGALRRSLAQQGKAPDLSDALPDHLTLLDYQNLTVPSDQHWRSVGPDDAGFCEIPVRALVRHSAEITAYLPDYQSAIDWAHQLTMLHGVQLDCMAYCPDDARFLGIGNGEHAVLSLKVEGTAEECQGMVANIRAQMFATNGGPLPFIQTLPGTEARRQHLARLPGYRTCLARFGVVSNQHLVQIPWAELSTTVAGLTGRINMLGSAMGERVFASQRLLGGSPTHAVLQTSTHIRSMPCRAMNDWQFVRETLDLASAA